MSRTLRNSWLNGSAELLRQREDDLEEVHCTRMPKGPYPFQHEQVWTQLFFTGDAGPIYIRKDLMLDVFIGNLETFQQPDLVEVTLKVCHYDQLKKKMREPTAESVAFRQISVAANVAADAVREESMNWSYFDRYWQQQQYLLDKGPSEMAPLLEAISSSLSNGPKGPAPKPPPPVTILDRAFDYWKDLNTHGVEPAPLAPAKAAPAEAAGPNKKKGERVRPNNKRSLAKAQSAKQMATEGPGPNSNSKPQDERDTAAVEIDDTPAARAGNTCYIGSYAA